MQYAYGIQSGMMTQPASAYYYVVYGGYLDLKTDKEVFITRISYLERPKFSSNGFTDQDFSGFALLGTKINPKSKYHNLYTYIGYGQVTGYTYKKSDKTLRSSKTTGFDVEIEYLYKTKHFHIGASSILFTGLKDKEQTDAKVAWPYNFLLFKIGGQL